MSNYLSAKTKLILLMLILFFLNEVIYSQCYIVASQKHKNIMMEVWGVTVPDRQGSFTSYQECVDYLDRSMDFDPIQRAEHWCDCDETGFNDSNSPNIYQSPNIIIPDRETQLNNARMQEEIELKQKAKLESEKINQNKKDLLVKMKKNKALDQLKTSSELSAMGNQNTNINQLDAGRTDSESAFTEGKIKLKGRNEQKIIPVSPPKPVDSQKSLFEYIDRETRTVQNKIMNVQREKIKILEKKNDIQKTINEQTIKIAKLETERLEVKDETKKVEIDSLLLMANQLLQESEDLNYKAEVELQEKNKLEQDNEALLNNYRDIYNKSKEHPEQSEKLLKNLEERNDD